MDELWASWPGVPADGEAAGLGCSAASSGLSSGVGALSARERLSRAGGVGSVIVVGGREEGRGDAAACRCSLRDNVAGGERDAGREGQKRGRKKRLAGRRKGCEEERSSRNDLREGLDRFRT